jgi:tetratricopeptide (TPR) repeat protein
LEDFDASHAEFETALSLGKRNCQGLTDFIQIAEILNNLGVLTFMCGDQDASLNHFKESLQVQHAMLSHSLYGGSNIMGHGITLNISVTRANIGFVKLVSKDFPAAMIAFESALMVSASKLLNVSFSYLTNI